MERGGNDDGTYNARAVALNQSGSVPGEIHSAQNS